MWGEAGAGIVLAAWGAGFARLMRVLPAREGYLERSSERRWRTMRWFSPRIWFRRETREAWIARDVDEQRTAYRVGWWIAVGIAVLGVVLLVYALIH